MKKILVTGGTGFIGSHTVVALQEKGYEVVIVDNLSNSTESVVSQIAAITGIKPVFVKLDLSDAQACKHFFAEYTTFDAIIHFAAAKAVGESVEKPLFYYKNNIVSLLNVLEQVSIHHILHFVFSSSCTVYGQSDHLPVDEDTPRQKAESPYGNTKAIAEDILSDIAKVSPLSVLALRYFNPIGAHPSAKIGELPIGVPNNLLPYITQTAIGKRACLSVFGNDYNTPDGTPIRDYIHVCDLAEAHVLAMEYMFTSHPKEIEYYNLGTGNGFSVLEVIKSFERSSGVKLNYQIVARRAGDIEQIWGNPQKAEKMLGWKAKRNIDEMTLSAWRWEQKLAQSLKK
ncbi:MAG: UDP-glucose 4-epimerase GalE [Bacteroidales bacterium]